MENKIVYFLSAAVIVIALYSCNNDNSEENSEEVEVSEEVLATNEWIHENLELYYFWNTYIPSGIDYTNESDPEAYFYKLLYDEEDKWSYITDDYASLSAEFAGEPVTMGYYPSFYLVGSNTVIMAVAFVYPGSAADEAGLKRGDIILSIDNTVMDTTNYYELYSGTSYSVQLGTLEGNTLVYTGESVSITAQTTTTDPAIYHEILEINNNKIGYLVYVQFVTGDDEAFLTTLDDIFNEFRTAGITDLVIDLRYNPGGEIDAATYLASEIAPTAVVNSSEILVNMQYNDDLQDFLEYYHYNDYLYCKFSSSVTGSNLSTVYFLTTSGTASASELVITGLEPYMNVIQIGESTYGKYTGAWVIPDDNEEWAILPIVSKYANANGYTDFVDGLTPDYEINDDLITAVPFGSTSDPMLAKAIELATGASLTSKIAKKASAVTYKQLVSKDMLKRKNLFIPAVSDWGK